MIEVALGLSAFEAIALLGVVIALVRLHARMNSLSNRADGALVQMRDWVAEAEELSAALADRLNERPRRATEKVEATAVLASAQRRETTPPVLQFAPPEILPRQAETEEDVDQLLVRRVAARRAESPSTPSADRTAARERSMDPAGVALQRLIWSRDAKGSA